MAYDPNGSYEPPRRAYYGQAQQQVAPSRNDGYGYPAHDQYAGNNGGYGQYNEHDGYNGSNGYADQGSYGRQNDYTGDYGQMNPYENGHGGMNGYHDQSNGWDERQHHQQPRQYDPRYQQRSDRGYQQQQDYDRQQRRPNPQQQHQDPSRSGRPAYQSDQRYADQYPPESRSNNPQNQRSHGRRPSHSSNPSSRSGGAAPPQPDSKRSRPGGSMEDWKAKERERMHAETTSPQNKTWDNAFPVFPTSEKKRDRSRPAPDGRSNTGNSQSPNGRQNGRPSASREQSAQDVRQPRYAVVNGNADDQNAYALEKTQIRGQGQPPASASQQQYGYDQRPGTAEVHSPGHEYSQQQWSNQDQYSGPQGRQDRRISPPQAGGPFGDNGHNAQRQYADQGYDRQPQPQQQQQVQRKPRGPAVQPIDTRQPLQQPRPAYMDHQPLSPANVPPRPSTATGDRYQQGNERGFMQGSTQGQYQAEASQQGYGDIYGAYAGESQTSTANAPAPRTREEEIEAEMPDFDSAAPSQTSMLHKRLQPGGNTSPTAQATAGMPPPQLNNSAQSLPSAAQRSMGQQQTDYSTTSLPEQRGERPQQGRGMDGYGGGGQQYHDQGPDPYGNGNGNGQQQQRYPPASFQPPYANEQGPRRSMDDARQMPYRPGPPPGQRGGPNGPGPRGPPGPPGQSRPPPGQPDMNRSYQRPPPLRQDPVQDRGGSAPPMRPGGQRPPPNGVPGGPGGPQQRDVPQQPPSSAPPTQATFNQAQTERPDRLPHHPTPVRPGLIDSSNVPPSKPPPIRNYEKAGVPPPQPPPKQQSQRPPKDRPKQPITMNELNQLRASVESDPNNYAKGLDLVKKLVEASTVLASEGGRADPRTTAKNRERYILDAHKRLKRLAMSGYADAQFYLADCYGQGLLGLQADEKEAFNLYQAAAKGGHAQAAFRTAVCCEIGPEDGGGTRKDYAKAVQWYRRAATLGDTAGMFKLGIIMLRGLLGQQPNAGEAINWLKRAAEQADAENPHALYELATLYEPATSVAHPEIRNKLIPDEKHARDLFQRAAQLGHRASQFRLGQAYEYGTLFLPIDHRSSIAWYSKSAAQGDHQAELALAGWYLTGAEGILEHSDTEAYLWARKAASAEPPLAKAMYAMGHFTETGIGCPANLEEAKRWYGRAASYKFPKAQERLEELRRNPNRGAGAAARGPDNGRLTRKDQKRDEAECTVM